MSTWNKEENIRDAGHWLARKVELIELKDRNKKKSIAIKIERGGIFNVELGQGNIGGEKNKTRPCLVLSQNNLNTGDTVVIIPLTTKFKTKTSPKGAIIPMYRNHYILKKSKYGFLKDDSCVKCEDIKSVDKIRIQDRLGNVDLKDLKLIKNRLLFTMGY